MYVPIFSFVHRGWRMRRIKFQICSVYVEESTKTSTQNPTTLTQRAETMPFIGKMNDGDIGLYRVYKKKNN